MLEIELLDIHWLSKYIKWSVFVWRGENCKHQFTSSLIVPKEPIENIHLHHQWSIILTCLFVYLYVHVYSVSNTDNILTFVILSRWPYGDTINNLLNIKVLINNGGQAFLTLSTLHCWNIIVIASSNPHGTQYPLSEDNGTNLYLILDILYGGQHQLHANQTEMKLIRLRSQRVTLINVILLTGEL